MCPAPKCTHGFALVCQRCTKHASCAKSASMLMYAIAHVVFLPCPFSVVLQVFQINPIKAWSAVAITLASVAASLYLISVSPWYLLPFAWFIAGTAFTGVSAFCYPAPHPPPLQEPYV